MGWIADDLGHEGYVVGLRATDTLHFRELATGDVDQPVHHVQAGCDCGWRSSRFHAPATAEWWPSIVELHDDTAEEELYAAWKRHVEDVRGYPPRRLAIAK
jgi:hypothetical protein